MCCESALGTGAHIVQLDHAVTAMYCSLLCDENCDGKLILKIPYLSSVCMDALYGS